MGDNLYFIESIYTPADSTNSVVTLFPTKEEEQAVIVRNLEEGQLKMHNHRGTIREGWYVYVDEGKQVPFAYGNLSLYARGQFRDYYALRNQLAVRLITADSEGAIVPSCFQDPKTKVTSYHVNVGHGNCSLVLIESGSFYQIWMVDCSIIDKTDRWRSYKGNLELCFKEIAKKLGRAEDAKLHIDRFFLTHAHHDHYNGIEYLINNGLIDIRTVCYVNIYYQMAGKAYNKMLKALYDAKVKIVEPISGNSKEAISFLHPEKRIYRSKATVKNTSDDYRIVDRPVNDSSVVLKVNAGGKTMVFPGDLERGGFDKMTICKACSPILFGIDYYSISHHGSLNGHPDNACLNPDPNHPGKPLDCISIRNLKAILMGRDGAYNGIYSPIVTSYWNGRTALVKTEDAPHFVELEWENGVATLK